MPLSGAPTKDSTCCICPRWGTSCSGITPPVLDTPAAGWARATQTVCVTDSTPRTICAMRFQKMKPHFRIWRLFAHRALEDKAHQKIPSISAIFPPLRSIHSRVLGFPSDRTKTSKSASTISRLAKYSCRSSPDKVYSTVSTHGGWVGPKPARLGGFLVQSGRFLVVQKLIDLNLGSNIWFLAPHIWVCEPHIWFLALNIWILALKS